MTIKEMHMVLHRNLGPFGTTAIGLGEMPLTIENNLGHDKASRPSTPHSTPAAVTSTRLGPTTAPAAKSRPVKS